jgi:hypothetical protein
MSLAQIWKERAVVNAAKELTRRMKEGRDRGEDFIFLDKALAALGEP